MNSLISTKETEFIIKTLPSPGTVGFTELYQTVKGLTILYNSPENRREYFPINFMKYCSDAETKVQTKLTLLTIRELYIKATVRYLYTSIRMAKIKRY